MFSAPFLIVSPVTLLASVLYATTATTLFKGSVSVLAPTTVSSLCATTLQVSASAVSQVSPSTPPTTNVTPVPTLAASIVHPQTSAHSASLPLSLILMAHVHAPLHKQSPVTTSLASAQLTRASIPMASVTSTAVSPTVSAVLLVTTPAPTASQDG